MLISKDLQLERKCESCGSLFSLPASRGPRQVALAAAERRGCFLCKKCRLAENTKRYGETDHAKETRTIHRRAHSEQRNTWTKRWRDRMRAEGKIADLNRKYAYGITPEQYKAMCERDPVCAICGCSDKPLVVDHDHGTGKVRGRLCTKCNTAIGKLGDSVARLLDAVKYLQERTC